LHMHMHVGTEIIIAHAVADSSRTRRSASSAHATPCAITMKGHLAAREITRRLDCADSALTSTVKANQRLLESRCLICLAATCVVTTVPYGHGA